MIVFSGRTNAIAESVGGTNYGMKPAQLELSVKPALLNGIADHFISTFKEKHSTLMEFKEKFPDIYFKLLATINESTFAIFIA